MHARTRTRRTHTALAFAACTVARPDSCSSTLPCPQRITRLGACPALRDVTGFDRSDRGLASAQPKLYPSINWDATIFITASPPSHRMDSSTLDHIPRRWIPCPGPCRLRHRRRCIDIDTPSTLPHRRKTRRSRLRLSLPHRTLDLFSPPQRLLALCSTLAHALPFAHAHAHPLRCLALPWSGFHAAAAAARLAAALPPSAPPPELCPPPHRMLLTGDTRICTPARVVCAFTHTHLAGGATYDFSVSKPLIGRALGSRALSGSPRSFSL